jgi:hypothetical protein
MNTLTLPSHRSTLKSSSRRIATASSRGLTSIPVRTTSDSHRRLWNPRLLDSLRAPLSRYRD